MLRRASIAALVVLAALLAAAFAATVSRPDATTLRYEASAGIGDLLRLSLADASTNVLFDINSSGDTIAVAAPCVLSGADVKCRAPRSPAS
jgi:hypothetical protein